LHILAKAGARKYSPTDLAVESRESAVNMRNRNSSRWPDVRDSTVSAQGDKSEDCTSSAKIRANRNSMEPIPICKFVHGKNFRFCSRDVTLASPECNFCRLVFVDFIDGGTGAYLRLDTAKFADFL